MACVSVSYEKEKVHAMSIKRYVLGICGGSGSGKSYMVEKIVEHFALGSIALLDQDSYYKDLSNLHPEERSSINFDHPNAIDFEQLVNDLEHLSAGNSIRKPLYDFNTHTRLERGDLLKSSPIIILEGHHIFYHPEILGKIDHKVYLDIENDIRFIRRLVRDIKERGRDVDSVVQQYLETVRPMDIQFVQPAKKYADTVINSNNYQDKFSDLIELLQGCIEKGGPTNCLDGSK